MRRRGFDTAYRLKVDFLDAVNGTTKRLTLSDGPVLDVAIPPGTRDGQTLRLRGKGMAGQGGAPAGDALVDQVHGLRRTLRRLLEARATPPGDAGRPQ
jgi:DnaJ-class molecular chaperone